MLLVRGAGFYDNDKSMAQLLGPVLGLTYLLVGVAGFVVTGFDNFFQDTDEALMGFSLNPFHNVVHGGAGLFLIIMTTLFSTEVAEGALMGAGLFLIVAFVIGVSGPDNLTILSMRGEGDPENFNHLVVGVAVFAVGLVSSIQSGKRLKRQGLA
jgi:hypothetical protein